MHFWFLFIGIISRVTLSFGDVPAKTAQYAADYCASAVTATTYSTADANLVDFQVGSPNYLEQYVFDQSCSDILTCVENDRSNLIMVALRVGVGIVLAIITLLFLIILGPCACCRCCRESRCWCGCRVYRPVGKNMSSGSVYALTALAVLFTAGLIAGVIYSVKYVIQMEEGSNDMLCQTFSLASEALNGNNGTVYKDPVTGQSVTHTFIGTGQLTVDVDSLNTTLAITSPILQQIDQTITDTQGLDYALAAFGSYLNFVNSILGMDTNLNVNSYECFTCEACCGGSGSYIDQLTSITVPQSYAHSLNQLRSEIKDNLTPGSGLDSINSALSQATNLVTDVNTRFEQEVGTNLVDNKDTIDLVMSVSKWSSIGVIALIGLPTFLLIASLIWGVYLSDRPSYVLAHIVPASPCPPCCGWFWSFVYAIIIFIIVGAMGFLGYFGGSTCQMTANSDTFIDNVYFRIDNQTSVSATNTKIAIDTCFKSNGTGILLDQIIVDDTTQETAQDILSIAQILENDLNAIYAETTAPTRMVDEPVFQRLLWVMRQFGSLYMFPSATIDSMRASIADPTTPAQTTLYETGFGGVPDCAGRSNVPLNGTVGEWVYDSLIASGYAAIDLPTTDPGNSVSVTGSTAYYNAAVAAGETTGSAGNTCPNYNPTNVNNGPWDTIMIDRMSVLSKTNYRCDTVTVTQSASFTPIVATTPVSCNFAQFTAYINTMANQLEASATALDVAAADAAQKIDLQIRSPIEESIIPPMDEITDGLDCKFIYDRWQYVYRSLCWNETPGIIGLTYSLMGLAVLAIIALIIQFVIWRHLQANYSAWKRVTTASSRDVSGQIELTPQVVTTSAQSKKGGANVVVVG